MPQSIKQVSSLADFQKPCNKCSVLQTKAPLYLTSTRGTAESKICTLRTRNSRLAHFSINYPAVKFLDPSPDPAGMAPAEREDAKS